MYALRSLFPRACCSRRALSTAAFVAEVEKVQQQLTSAQDRRTELLRHGRHLFETEALDDLSRSYSCEVAATLCHAASQLRISPIKGQPFVAVVAASTEEAALATMNADALARIIHSCLVLRSPQLFDVLFTYLRPLIKMAPDMSAVSVAVILNAYGRSGVRHEELYSALCNRGATCMKDPRLALAHVANVAHALSKVRFAHPPLMQVLRDQAIRMCSTAAPLVAVTILDAFASLDMVDEELFQLYEERLLSQLADLPAPLLASLLTCLATAQRGQQLMSGPLSDRIVALAPQCDSVSITKSCDAYARVGVLAEAAFGALAERATSIAGEFRADEIATLLHALSSFDLFDGELYPLLASRLSTISRQNGFISLRDAAGILASFAAVQERDETVIHVCTQVLAAHPGEAAVDPVGCINALWGCAMLNVHNEAQLSLVAKVKANPALISLPQSDPQLPERLRSTLEARRVHAAKVYAIGLPA